VTVMDHCYRVLDARLAENRYALHQLIAALPASAAPGDGRIQWALIEAEPALLRVRTGTDTAPRLGDGVEPIGSCAIGAATCDMAIVLEACPVVRTTRPGGGAGPYRLEKPHRWLRDRLRQGGGLVTGDIWRIQPALRLTKARNGRRLSFARARWAADVHVFDPAAFTRLIRSGVGPGKAFGLGMIVPV